MDVYYGPLCFGYNYVLNCHFVYAVDIPGTRPLFVRKQNLFILFICNHKSETSYLFKHMKQVSYKRVTSHMSLYTMRTCMVMQLEGHCTVMCMYGRYGR